MLTRLRALPVRYASSLHRPFGTDTGRDLSWNTEGVNRHGFPWPPDCTEASLTAAERWRPGPQDVFVSTYPKSGTTWMLHLAYQLASKGDFSFTAFHHVHPLWEGTGDLYVALDKAPIPRVIKTHAPPSLVPSFLSGGGKLIYVVRDPRDTLVSFYHHSLLTQQLPGQAKSFPEFFDQFLAGRLYYGSWFDHVTDALQYQGNERVLLVSYEEMMRDLRSVVQSVIRFTGYDVPADLLEGTIMPRLSFKFMKKHDAVFDFTLGYPTRNKEAQFFRKGQVGDHEGRLTEPQRDLLRQKYDALNLGARLPYRL